MTPKASTTPEDCGAGLGMRFDLHDGRVGYCCRKHERIDTEPLEGMLRLLAENSSESDTQ